MGYFDALTSSSFKTTEDGRRLFFPWGSLGRGYAIPSEQEYERLRGTVKGYMTVALIVAVMTGMLVNQVGIIWHAVVGGFAIVAALSGLYLFWVRSQLRELTPVDDRLTAGDSFRAQASAHNTVVLWLLVVIALLLVGGGVLILIVEPDKWMPALASIGFFGLCAAVFAKLLIAKRRSTRARQ